MEFYGGISFSLNELSTSVAICEYGWNGLEGGCWPKGCKFEYYLRSQIN